MKHPKHQHYVPRLYLRQFAAERGKNPPIYSFDKTTQHVRRPSVRAVAAEVHFYERGDQGIEKWLGDVENKFASPYRRLLTVDSLDELSAQDVAAIMLFLAVQLVRTREQREAIKSIGKAIRDMLDREGGEYDPEWADVSDETARMQQIEMLPDLVTRYMENMVRLKWVLFVNQTPMPLWTSDHPVTLDNQRPATLMGNLGLKCRGIEVHFPLSPMRSLCLCDPMDYGTGGHRVAGCAARHAVEQPAGR